MRRPISSALHGLFDYPLGILLIVSPWLFGFAFMEDEGLALAASAIPFVIGLMVLGQSLITDYEFSVLNLLPLPVHLALDVVAGIVLLVSPFVLGFASGDVFPQPSDVNTGVFHPIAGLLLIGSGLLTEPRRRTERGEMLRTLDPTMDKHREQEPESSGRFRRTDQEFPDRTPPGPDAIDVAQTGPESQSGRPTTTGQ